MTKNLKWIALAVLLAIAPNAALADYIIKDGNGVVQTIRAGVVAGKILPYMTPVDGSGNALGVVGNPLAIQFGTGISLPSFGVPQHFICDSGCSGGGGGSSYTVTYGTAIGTLGTPTGFKDLSGNFQPLLGDANGQYISIRASVAVPVTGVFFQATQPVSGTVAFSNSTIAVTNAGTFAVQLSGSTNNINNVSGTISLPTGAATSAAQTTGNTSLSSIDTKTPALGQALSAASTPVVLPAAQITTLTPPSSVGISGTLPAFASPPQVLMSGTTGTDSSANAAAVPANSDLILLATVAVSATRALVGVQNQSGGTIQIVRDDGSGGNQTSLFVGGPFGFWNSASFKGRVRVYGLSGSMIAAYQD